MLFTWRFFSLLIFILFLASTHFTCLRDSHHLLGSTPLPPLWEDPVVTYSSFQEWMEMHLDLQLLGGFLHLSTRNSNFCLSALVLYCVSPSPQACEILSQEVELRDSEEKLVVSKWHDALGLNESLGKPELWKSRKGNNGRLGSQLAGRN